MSLLSRLLIGPVLAAAAFTAAAQQPDTHPDIEHKPTLYVVGYAHLDTEWRWEYPQVINEYLAKTMHDNFALFEKYPHYIFNFSGANRYRLMKEYYPRDYAIIQKYVAAGRWFPAGSSMEESDVNSPSAESILRQVLYGNRYFQHDFGKYSNEYMLPDCFGFPATLPSLLAHAGVKGFSTQKLTWGSAAPVGGSDSIEHTPEGTPFNVGIWNGPDGKGLLAALNPGSYGSTVRRDLSVAPPESAKHETDWVSRIDLDGKATGLFADYHYVGTGDVGGAPDEESIRLLEAIVDKSKVVLPGPEPAWWEGDDAQPAHTGPEVQVGDGPVTVVPSQADRMFLDILATGKQNNLPKYEGDLELTNHSAGSLTSEAYQKRWNRQNELLADAAEKASVAAAWLGALPYPQDRLNNAWTLVMGGQFHDIMAGTATPRAYEFSWNDDVIAMNQFADVTSNASEAVAASLDTKGPGQPVIIYNPLSIAREDVAEATLTTSADKVRVIGPDGRPVPSQIENGKILFVAKAPSAGYAVYHLETGHSADHKSTLSVGENKLENTRYRVTVNAAGDISSIFDKKLNKELLAEPLRLAFQSETPQQWPAWNMDWADQQKPSRAYVSGTPKITIAEKGPVRVALKIERESEGSKFIQTVRLSAGDAGNRVEIANQIDWKSSTAALKATFPLTASNSVATYNWDVATIERSNNDPKKFEVPSHQFIDLTDRSGTYGVTILTDCKNGSDKPSDNTLRLTLLYTPGISRHGHDYSDQSTQDWGHHEFVYGLAGHPSDWRSAQTDWQALRLNQPLLTFFTAPHEGSLGKEFSIVKLDNERVRVMALKKAEDTDEIILRVVETGGKPQSQVRISFPAAVTSAKEVDGQEHELGTAQIQDGHLVTDFTPHQIHTFALSFAKSQTTGSEPTSQPIALNYDAAIATRDRQPAKDAGFDEKGDSYPAEMLPQDLAFNGIHFHLTSPDGPNAVTAKGQSVDLPSGNLNRVYVLAAADGDQTAEFKIGDRAISATIQNWTGFIGQWDDRTWTTKTVPNEWPKLPSQVKPDSPQAKAFEKFKAEHPTREEREYAGLNPGFIKRAPIAWYASHHHNAKGENEAYSYSYLFAYEFDVPAGAKTLTLPNNPHIRIVAITAAGSAAKTEPARPLYDVLGSDAANRVTEPAVNN